MHLMACRARDKVITLRTACILCTRYSVPAAVKFVLISLRAVLMYLFYICVASPTGLVVTV